MNKKINNKNELERLTTIVENNRTYIEQLRTENMHYKHAISRVEGTYAWKLYRLYKKIMKKPIIKSIIIYLRFLKRIKK